MAQSADARAQVRSPARSDAIRHVIEAYGSGAGLRQTEFRARVRARGGGPMSSLLDTRLRTLGGGRLTAVAADKASARARPAATMAPPPAPRAAIGTVIRSASGRVRRA